MVYIISSIIIATSIVAIIYSWHYFKNKHKAKEFMSFMESLNLTDLPIVTFTVNNQKLNFLLDTGCTISIINKSLIPDLKVQMLKATSNVFGMEGNIVQCPLCRMTLEYKNNTYVDNFQILDLDESFSKIKKESGVSVHGLLGTGFFQHYKSTLDFEEMKAYFKK